MRQEISNQRDLNEAWWMGIVLTMKNDSWFVTLSFPFNVPRYTAEQKVNEWLRRLKQALRLKDGFEAHCVYAYQQREVLHVHITISASGLNHLDRSHWEEKWKEISGHKRTEKYTHIVAHRHPGVIRRRPGEQDAVISSVIEYEKEVIAEIPYYAGGGTCVISQIDTPQDTENVAGYLLARHSREIEQNCWL